MISKDEFDQLVNQYASLPRKHPIDNVALLDLKIKAPDAASFISQVRSLFLEQEYRCELAGTPIILDIGANIGLSSIYFSRLFPSANIYAYEADPSIFNYLMSNIEKNNISNVHLANHAVWVKSETLLFESTNTDAGHLSKEALNPVEVSGIDFDKELDKFEHIDLFKMDIESAENQVFPHIRKHLFKVDLLLLEYHSPNNEKQNLSEIIKIIEEEGFRYHIHQINKRRMPLINRIPPGFFDCQLNIFAYKE